ncbi:hypothetical protein FH972_025861 [Carpinus fangiana]|uniref:Uncharacterized protein n=1 Tax=Carpinus fangiana TaxID=176857 RepID=A0A5N6L4U1_9ROSI|nr:hypothetical protein FH972_025861 [Carpinus fangiana]
MRSTHPAHPSSPPWPSTPSSHHATSSNPGSSKGTSSVNTLPNSIVSPAAEFAALHAERVRLRAISDAYNRHVSEQTAALKKEVEDLREEQKQALFIWDEKAGQFLENFGHLTSTLKADNRGPLGLDKGEAFAGLKAETKEENEVKNELSSSNNEVAKRGALDIRGTETKFPSAVKDPILGSTTGSPIKTRNEPSQSPKRKRTTHTPASNADRSIGGTEKSSRLEKRPKKGLSEATVQVMRSPCPAAEQDPAGNSKAVTSGTIKNLEVGNSLPTLQSPDSLPGSIPVSPEIDPSKMTRKQILNEVVLRVPEGPRDYMLSPLILDEGAKVLLEKGIRFLMRRTPAMIRKNMLWNQKLNGRHLGTCLRLRKAHSSPYSVEGKDACTRCMKHAYGVFCIQVSRDSVKPFVAPLPEKDRVGFNKNELGYWVKSLAGKIRTS